MKIPGSEAMYNPNAKAPATVYDFKQGDRVRYVPLHAHGDISHQDCENGIVSSTNDKYVFVRYYYKNGGLREGGQATDPCDLVKT